MSVGLIALLDDIAALAKMAATTLDDVAAQAAKAGSKAAAVVIDDAAVTPKYVVGIHPNRELPVIAKIAFASLRNKLFILLPIALTLSYFAPWVITPLLMFGGAYLCYEGTEKLYQTFWPHKAHKHEKIIAAHPVTPEQLENATVQGAVRTDFILSAEIVAISLASVTDIPILNQIIVLIIISFAITFGVYGVVALIVKADDFGLALAKRDLIKNPKKSSPSLVAVFGTGIVKSMPTFLWGLSWVGTIAMLWVGGSIIVHGLAVFGFETLEHTISHIAGIISNQIQLLPTLVTWITTTFLQGLTGIFIGLIGIPFIENVVAPLSFKISKLINQKTLR